MHFQKFCFGLFEQDGFILDQCVAEATHLTLPAVLVTLEDVSSSADQNMARHNRHRPLFSVTSITWCLDTNIKYLPDIGSAFKN